MTEHTHTRTHTHTHTTPSSNSTWSSKFPQLRTVHCIYYPVPRDSICGLKSPLEKCGPEWVEHRLQGPLSSCTGLNRVQSYLGLPCPLTGKESACNGGDTVSISERDRSSGEGNGNSLQYPCLENPMGRRTWWATVHGITKSQTRLSD